MQAKQSYEICYKELLAISLSLKEWRHYVEGNPNQLEVIMYTTTVAWILWDHNAPNPLIS